MTKHAQDTVIYVKLYRLHRVNVLPF